MFRNTIIVLIYHRHELLDLINMESVLTFIIKTSEALGLNDFNFMKKKIFCTDCGLKHG
jgi:hypothetical protein